ncbi:hypothetical protein [Salana multivorans]
MDRIYALRRPLALGVAILVVPSAMLVLFEPGVLAERSATFYLVTTGLGLVIALVLAATPRLGPNLAWLLPFLGGLLLAAGAGPGVVGSTMSKVIAVVCIVALVGYATVALVHKVDTARERPVSRL